MAKEVVKKITSKCIVKTLGDTTMLIPVTYQHINHDRPTVVPRTEWIDAQVHEGNLISVATNLPMEADDFEFRKCFLESKKDERLAIESFCASYGQSTDGTKISIEKKPKQPKE